MQIGIQIRPSRTKSLTDIGHAGLYWENEDSTREFRGFVFRPDELPEAFRSPSEWRNYLFDHACPGYIIEDLQLQDDFKHRRDALRFAIRELSDEDMATVKKATRPQASGRYTFSPDSLECCNTPPRCNNCVTWCVRLLQPYLNEKLPDVRDGRLKLLIAELERTP